MNEVLVECRKKLCLSEQYVIHETFKQWLKDKKLPKRVSSNRLMDLISEFVLDVTKFYIPKGIPAVAAPDDIAEIELNNKALELLRIGADQYIRYARNTVKGLASDRIYVNKFLRIMDGFIAVEVKQHLDKISRI